MTSPASTGIITLSWLRQQGICQNHLDIFERLHGDQSKPTRDSLQRSVKAGLDLEWLASRLFDAEPHRVWKEATAEAYRVWKEATAEPRRVWKKATAEPRRVWEEAIAEGFWRAYQLQFGEQKDD